MRVYKKYLYMMGSLKKIGIQKGDRHSKKIEKHYSRV